MKNNVTKLLAFADQAVKDKLVENNGRIAKEYNGYISSFGAAIVQSGLMPALYFNHQKDSGSAKDRKKLMDTIFQTIINGYNITTDKSDLLKYAKQDTVDLKQLKQQILGAATAIKLVIRTYELK